MLVFKGLSYTFQYTLSFVPVKVADAIFTPTAAFATAVALVDQCLRVVEPALDNTAVPTIRTNRTRGVNEQPVVRMVADPR